MQQSPNPIRSFDPHREKIKKFYDESQTFLKEKTVWRHLCGGWYHDPVTDFILQWLVFLRACSLGSFLLDRNSPHLTFASLALCPHTFFQAWASKSLHGSYRQLPHRPRKLRHFLLGERRGEAGSWSQEKGRDREAECGRVQALG